MNLIDRLALLRRAFKDLLTITALADVAGVSPTQVYAEIMSREALGKIAEGAATLFGELRQQGIDLGIAIDVRRVSGWLVDGVHDSSLEEFLGGGFRICLHCHPPRLVPMVDWIGPTGRCADCHNKKGFQRRLEHNPGLARYYADLAAQLPLAQKLDPELAAEVGAAFVDGRPIRPINKMAIARKFGTTRGKFEPRWRAAGFAMLLLSISSVNLADLNPGSSTPPPGVGDDRRRRKGPNERRRGRSNRSAVRSRSMGRPSLRRAA